MKTRPQTERNTVVYLCARVFGRSPHRPWCRHRYGRGGGGHLCGRGTGGWQSKNQCFFFQLCCVILFQASYSTHLHAHLPISKYLFNVSTLSQNHSFCSLAKLCLPISSNAYGPNLTYPTMTKPSQETWGNWGNAVAPLFKLARKRLHSEKWAWNFITVMSQLPALVLPSKEFCVSPATKTFPDASTCATASTAWVQS